MDDPTDSLASTATYLQRNGWTGGVGSGAETSLSDGNVIQPQAGGLKFTATGDFRAIKRYDNSDAYAIGVGHLAD